MNLRNIVILLFVSIFFPWLGLPILFVMAIVTLARKTEPLGLVGRRSAQRWAREHYTVTAIPDARRGDAMREIHRGQR